MKLSPKRQAEYDLKFGKITKDGHTMFLDDVVKEILALQRTVNKQAQTIEDLQAKVERLRNSLAAITKAAQAMGMNEKACLILHDAKQTLKETGERP